MRSDLLFERGLPEDAESEKAILGHLIYTGTAPVDADVSLKASHFSMEAHRRIFKALEVLAEAGTPITISTVALRLRESGKLESIGGVTYLTELDSGHGVQNTPAFLSAMIASVKEKYIRRGCLYHAQAVLDRASRADMSTDEILSNAIVEFEKLAREGVSKSDWLTVGDVIERNEDGLQALLAWRKHSKGIQTPWPAYNRLTGGLQRGELIILAARPSMGKSAMAYQIAQHVALDPNETENQPIVAIVSLEMSEESIICRFVPQIARVDGTAMSWDGLDSTARARALRAANALSESGIRFDGNNTSNIRDLKARVHRLHAQTPLKLLIIDHLNLMEGEDFTRNEVLSKITRQLKLLAGELNIPVLVLVQLSRAVEKRNPPVPILSDLRDSGSIEQDADIVLFIFRPEVYDRNRDDLKGMAELIIAKQRNGPIDTVKLVWLAEFGKFEPLYDFEH